MSNLISEVKVNHALLDQFVKDGPGLPDHVMLNPNTGERDISVLERIIGMTRAIRRMEAAKHKPGARIIDFHKSAPGRMLLLINDLYLAQQNCSHKTKSNNAYRSWEMIVFRRINNNWYDPQGIAAERFKKMSEEDQRALEAPRRM